jgi:hypothetical protein
MTQTPWQVGETYADHQFPAGVTEIVDGSGYVVALVPLHMLSARYEERRHWPELIVKSVNAAMDPQVTA